MKKYIFMLTLFFSSTSFAQMYTVTFSDGAFGRFSNYPAGRIAEVCIHNILYLMTDNGHLIVAVDRHNQPIQCQVEKQNK